ncbi:hypothetical protein RKE29_30515, partial [Streptomyces sp. B1866]|nr:hypothetical protein [Streptomyces sp. B1866]
AGAIAAYSAGARAAAARVNAESGPHGDRPGPHGDRPGPVPGAPDGPGLPGARTGAAPGGDDGSPWAPGHGTEADGGGPGWSSAFRADSPDAFRTNAPAGPLEGPPGSAAGDDGAWAARPEAGPGPGPARPRDVLDAFAAGGGP